MLVHLRKRNDGEQRKRRGGHGRRRGGANRLNKEPNKADGQRGQRGKRNDGEQRKTRLGVQENVERPKRHNDRHARPKNRAVFFQGLSLYSSMSGFEVLSC